MQVNTAQATQAAATTSSSSSSKSATATSMDLADFGSFLNLFVTQLKNQDPLNPTNQQDFLAQTAQFSSVEQLVDMNKKLGDFALAGKASAASLIGRKVEGKVTDKDGKESTVSGLVSQLDYGAAGDLVLGFQDGTSLPLTKVISISEA